MSVPTKSAEAQQQRALKRNNKRLYLMQNNTFSLIINSQKVDIQDLSPTLTLLEYLRSSGRVGTKEGCGDGDCGACTVAVVGQGANGQPQYLAMNSCLIPLVMMAGREIITVEGVGKYGLHPIQEAMVSLGVPNVAIVPRALL